MSGACVGVSGVLSGGSYCESGVCGTAAEEEPYGIFQASDCAFDEREMAWFWIHACGGQSQTYLEIEKS